MAGQSSGVARACSAVTHCNRCTNLGRHAFFGPGMPCSQGAAAQDSWLVTAAAALVIKLSSMAMWLLSAHGIFMFAVRDSNQVLSLASLPCGDRPRVVAGW